MILFKKQIVILLFISFFLDFHINKMLYLLSLMKIKKSEKYIVCKCLKHNKKH